MLPRLSTWVKQVSKVSNTTDQSWLVADNRSLFLAVSVDCAYKSKIDSERTSGLFRPDQPHSVAVSGVREAALGGLHRSLAQSLPLRLGYRPASVDHSTRIAFTRQKRTITAPDNVQSKSRSWSIKMQTSGLHHRLSCSCSSSADMNETIVSSRPELFLKHQDGTPVVFYLTSRIPEDWAIWIRSNGGSVATKPTGSQFVIFPKTELLPREEQQVDAFKKRDIPTVRLQWLVRMKRLRCLTSWTQWAMDPTTQIEPLVEDQELDVQLRMLGVDNIEDESVDLGEICKGLSRRFPHHPIRWFEEQLRGYRPDVLSTIHQEAPESSPAAGPSTAPLMKAESPMCYLPTPISSQQQSQSQSTEEYLLSSNNLSARPLEESFQTPRSNTKEAANNEPSHIVTPSQNQPLELGSEEGEQSEESGMIPGSPEDDVISDGPIMGGLLPTPISEQPHSPTPLEALFQGSDSPFGGDCDMDPLNREFLGVPPRLATNEAEAAARLFHGIDDLSNWEPTPSAHSYSRSDHPPPTFDNGFGLWNSRSESMERREDGDNTLYKEFDRVHASRVEEDEDKYAWKLLQQLIRNSTWTSPAHLGRQINRLLRTHGGKRDWEQYLSKEANYKEVQDIRRKWREVHWRARNPDADEDPPTHKWFTYGHADDPAMVRASPPEVSDDEPAELTPSRSRPKNRDRRASTSTRTAAGKKRKRATHSSTKTPYTHRDGVLAPLSRPSSSSSISPGRKEDLSNSESSQENVTQGRRKRRRFD